MQLMGIAPLHPSTRLSRPYRPSLKGADIEFQRRRGAIVLRIEGTDGVKIEGGGLGLRSLDGPKPLTRIAPGDASLPMACRDGQAGASAPVLNPSAIGLSKKVVRSTDAKVVPSRGPPRFSFPDHGRVSPPVIYR